jgi:peroxiredoxin Q/BCP
MVPELTAGMAAPDFTLPDQTGAPFTLSKARGKPVVLFFYSENDTPICTTHACNMQQVHTELASEGVRVVGISHDPVESHQAFRTKHHLDYTLLADPEKRVFALYNAWGEKNSYGRTIQGLLRSSFLIDSDGVIRKVFRRLNTKVNAGQLIAAYRSERV